MAEFPHYKRLYLDPVLDLKDPIRNAEYRYRVLEEGYLSEPFARTQWEMCSEDLLYYINTFVYTHDPRLVLPGQSPAIPFITYAEFQDEAIGKIVDAFGVEDVVIDKAREQGGSWIGMTDYQWECDFHEMRAMGAISRDLDTLDNGDDPDALFFKIDFIRKHLPCWMKAPDSAIRRTDYIYENHWTGGSIVGQACTADAYVGGRKASLWCDEVARWKASRDMMMATRGATRNRIFCSTQKGNTSSYAKLVKKAKAGEIVFVNMPWVKHPLKKPGMYTTRNQKPGGALQIIDTSFKFPPDYKFVLDGRMRSPWYDVERLRCETEAEANADLDQDPFGSEAQFYDERVQHIAEDTIEAPSFIGKLIWDPHTLEPKGFEEDKNGHWRIWQLLEASGMPTRLPVKYPIGADIAFGTGASNSTLAVLDPINRCKVAEYANPLISPEEFAIEAFVACKAFSSYDYDVGMESPAFLIWEQAGPGQLFSKKVLSLNHPSVYYQEAEDRSSRKRSDKPGWWPSEPSKMRLHGAFRTGIREKRYMERSEWCLEEMKQYVLGSHGEIINTEVRDSDDPSGAEKNHGDRVVATALAFRGLDEVGSVDPAKTKHVPRNSLQGRRDQRAREAVIDAEKMARRW